MWQTCFTVIIDHYQNEYQQPGLYADNLPSLPLCRLLSPVSPNVKRGLSFPIPRKLMHFRTGVREGCFSRFSVHYSAEAIRRQKSSW